MIALEGFQELHKPSYFAFISLSIIDVVGHLNGKVFLWHTEIHLYKPPISFCFAPIIALIICLFIPIL